MVEAECVGVTIDSSHLPTVEEDDAGNTAPGEIEALVVPASDALSSASAFVAGVRRLGLTLVFAGLLFGFIYSFEAFHVRLFTSGRKPLKRGTGHSQNASSPKFESSVHCLDTPSYNQSCLMRNVFFDPVRSLFELHVLNTTTLPTIRVQSWGGPTYLLDVRIKVFGSGLEMDAYSQALEPLHQRGLSLFFAAQWHDHWAHAFFDGLYAAYVALAKFGRHLEPFTPVADIVRHKAGLNCSSSSGQQRHIVCWVEEAFRLFAAVEGRPEAELLTLYKLTFRRHWTMFEELMIGSGHAGMMSSDITLPASLNFQYLPLDQRVPQLFVERMFKAHDVMPPVRRSYSHLERSGKLTAIMTFNRRMNFSHVQQLKAGAKLCSLRPFCGEALVASYVNWVQVQPLTRQLELLRGVDIHVSSSGTALFYTLFLSEGSASVNLGYPDNGDEPPVSGKGLPSYGEEFLGMANLGVRTLYLPLARLRRPGWFDSDDIANLLEEAAQIILEGFPIPLQNPQENLSPLGRIAHEVIHRSRSSMNGMLGLDAANLQYNMGDHWKCMPYKISDLVYEFPHSSSCHVDTAMLRQVKNMSVLPESFGGKLACECVVCGTCIP